MMITPVIGIIASSVGVILLVLLFNFEEKRGERIFETTRNSFDRLLQRTEKKWTGFLEQASSGLSRQAVHFFFHKILIVLLRFLKRCEERVDALLRSNRTLARKVRDEYASKSKLDELAEHKASVALSEEERKQRREESLNG